MKYIKELLKTGSNISTSRDDGITYSNSNKFDIYPNPADASSQILFELEDVAKVSVSIFDLNGRELSSPLINKSLQPGSYNFNLNISNDYKGFCLVRFTVNGNINVKKIMIQ